MLACAHQPRARALLPGNKKCLLSASYAYLDRYIKKIASEMAAPAADCVCAACSHYSVCTFSCWAEDTSYVCVCVCVWFSMCSCLCVCVCSSGSGSSKCTCHCGFILPIATALHMMRLCAAVYRSVTVCHYHLCNIVTVCMFVWPSGAYARALTFS